MCVCVCECVCVCLCVCVCVCVCVCFYIALVLCKSQEIARLDVMALEDVRFETPYNTAPFSKIKTETFLPAFVKAIESAKIEISQIVENKATPSFENTIEALEYTAEQLDRISSIFFNLNAAETNEEIQKIAQEVSPLLTEFSNDVALNTALFERVKSVYNNKESLSLTEEQKTLLDKKYKGFSRNGANLNSKQKELLRCDGPAVYVIVCSIRSSVSIAARTSVTQPLGARPSWIAEMNSRSMSSIPLLETATPLRSIWFSFPS